MTVATAYTPLTYAGNSATTAFAVTWPFFTGSLVVTLISADGTETVQSLGTHYSVTGGTTATGLPATGTVTMVTAPATGESLRIERSTPKTQASTWAESDPFPQKVVEAAFDKALLISQEAAYAAENPDQIDVSFEIGTVTTGAAGSSAAVTVTEAGDGEFTLDFTIPRGNTGASGPGTGDLISTNNLSDLTNAATARTNLGLGNVENKSSATIRGELTSGNITTALTYTPVDKAGDTMTGNLTLQLASATTADDYLILKPTDYAAGKPALIASKSATATQWNFGLWDGSSATGTLDFTVTALQHLGNTIWTDANVGARINALGTVTPDTTADYVPLYDASGGIAGKALFPAGYWDKIGDTTIGAPVASVEHTWTAGTYSAIRVVVSDVSSSVLAEPITVSLRHSGGAIITLTSTTAMPAISDVGTGVCEFHIGVDAATKAHYGRFEGFTTGSGGSGAFSVTGGGSNATAPDRIRVAVISSIDDGRIITYGLRV